MKKSLNLKDKFIIREKTQRISILELLGCFFIVPFGILDMFYHSQKKLNVKKAEQAFWVTLIGYISVNIELIYRDILSPIFAFIKEWFM